MSLNKFAGSSILLFIDQLLLATGGWAYWLIMSRFTSTSSIGDATAVYNLVLLGSTLSMLGLEYPLLRRTSWEKSRILGTALVLELIISLASVPLIIFVVNNFYQESSRQFIWFTIIMFVSSAVGQVPRFALLGISDAKSNLTTHSISIAIRFVAGYALIGAGFDTFGIIISFLLQFLSGTISVLAIGIRKLNLKIGDTSYFKSILKDGLINSPSKLSYMLIFNLSIVLLASFSINSSQIGVFYIALTVTTVVGSLGSSMAFMAIPASSESKTDLTSGSARISLGLSAPLIAGLIVAPKFILSVIGQEYASADLILVILSLGLLPYVITMNAISKFNHLNNPRKLLLIGSSQVLAFIISFVFLVPAFGTMGAAVSILIAFGASAIPSLIWSGLALARQFANSCIAVAAGVGAGYTISYAFEVLPIANININAHLSLIALVISIISSLAVVFALKNTSVAEIRQMVKYVAKKN